MEHFKFTRNLDDFLHDDPTPTKNFSKIATNFQNECLLWMKNRAGFVTIVDLFIHKYLKKSHAISFQINDMDQFWYILGSVMCWIIFFFKWTINRILNKPVEFLKEIFFNSKASTIFKIQKKKSEHIFFQIHFILPQLNHNHFIPFPCERKKVILIKCKPITVINVLVQSCLMSDLNVSCFFLSK